MSSPARKPEIDRDGVRVFERPKQQRKTRVALIFSTAAAAGLVATILWVRGSDDGALDVRSAGEQDGAARQRDDAGSWAVPASVRRREKPREAAREQKQPEVSTRDIIEALRAAGETEGIAAFNPPGTDPIKLGLVVPEDFELPEGYVRHYQVTDGGERLEPILMFSPDYEFLDASGNPVPLPESGIVPPEMAPPGLPHRTLEMPKNPYGPGERAGVLGRE
jgi:hypothetical protein